jgi:peptidylprolyl isomerase
LPLERRNGRFYARGMKRIFPAVLLLALVLSALALAGCGDDDSATSTPTVAVPTGGAGSVATAPPRTGTAAPPTAGSTTDFSTIKDATTTPSGLKYVDEVVGTGSSPRAGRSVTVSYVGTFTNGKKFDASADHGGTFSFIIGQGNVIKGWDEGVLTMKVGGKRMLYVPSALAYGTRGQGTIPPNTDLIFEVQLISVQQ